MSLIDLFKAFHRTAIQQEFPPGARVLFDTVVYKLNEAFWPDCLVFSERDLTHLTGLKKSTLHDAKHFLTSRHILECKGKSGYSLGAEFKRLIQPTTGRPPADHLPTTRRPPPDQTGCVRVENARKDVKTEDNPSPRGGEGGVKHGRTVRRGESYAEPVYRGDEPWFDPRFDE